LNLHVRPDVAWGVKKAKKDNVLIDLDVKEYGASATMGTLFEHLRFKEVLKEGQSSMDLYLMLYEPENDEVCVPVVE
jgi:hypothetical protein